MKQLTDQKKRRREYLTKRYGPLLHVLVGIVGDLALYLVLINFGPTTPDSRLIFGLIVKGKVKLSLSPK